MKKFILLITLSVLVLLPFHAIAGEFSDTKGHWALQSINECAAVGIVKGYPGGVLFKPEAPVSHLESLVMIVKSMGLEQQAEDLDVTKGNYNFPAGMTWGKEYLAVAADNNVINKEKMSYLETDGPTTRAEAAVMFVNALGLTSGGYTLTFTDNAQIPEIYKDSIAAAVKNGVMVGMPDNSFEPNRTVTRAEMVTIISRLFSKGLINPYPSNYFINKVTGIDKTNQLISLQKSNTASQPYILAEDCLIYKDGKKASLDDLQVSDNLKVVLDTNGKIKYLALITGDIPDYQEPSEPNDNTQTPAGTFSGVFEQIIPGAPLKAIITGSDQIPMVYSIDPAVKVVVSGVTKDITSIPLGSTVEFKLVANKITEIKVLSVSQENSEKAYVINVSLGYLSLHFANGDEKGYYTDYPVQFYKGNVEVNLSSLTRGDCVRVTKDYDRLATVTVLSNEPRKVFGEVTFSRPYSITIKDYDSRENSYVIDEDAEITNADGVDIEMEDVEQGEGVELLLDKNNRVVELKLDKRSATVTGRAITINTSGDYKLTVVRTNGAAKKYSVIDDVEVRDGSRSLDFDEILEGNEVELYLNSDNEVTRIEVTSDDRIITGVVEEIDDSGEYGITIEKLDGKSAKYEVDEDVDVKEGSRSLDFDDLREGDTVELTLDEDDLVTKVKVTDGEVDQESGIITDLDVEREEITIETDDDEVDYDLDSDVEITKDGSELDLDEVMIGAEVEIEIQDDKVVKIEITDDEDIEVEGEIIRLYSDAIKIEQASGNEFKFYFDSRASLEDEDGDDIEIEDLDVGQDVRLELRDGEIYRLEVL